VGSQRKKRSRIVVLQGGLIRGLGAAEGAAGLAIIPAHARRQQDRLIHLVTVPKSVLKLSGDDSTSTLDGEKETGKESNSRRGALFL
jgi:hypothetical protein